MLTKAQTNNIFSYLNRSPCQGTRYLKFKNEILKTAKREAKPNLSEETQISYSPFIGLLLHFKKYDYPKSSFLIEISKIP